MSERDARYAPWYEPALVFLALAIMLALTTGMLRSEIRDLQRRVGQIESEKR